MRTAGVGWRWVGSRIDSRRCWWPGRSCLARRATPSTIGCRSSLSPRGWTASSRGGAHPTTPRAGAGRRCRRGATSACCWSAASKASTASAGWSGAAPTACRCASSSASASASHHLAAVEAAPSTEAPAEMVADKGYHSRETLQSLDDGPWKTRIAEPRRDGFLHWHGDADARRAVADNRTRLLSGVARAAFKLRAEIVERGFALILDRGGMRRAWLRGRE